MKAPSPGHIQHGSGFAYAFQSLFGTALASPTEKVSYMPPPARDAKANATHLSSAWQAWWASAKQFGWQFLPSFICCGGFRHLLPWIVGSPMQWPGATVKPWGAGGSPMGYGR